MNRDELKGRATDLKGEVKEAAGDIANDEQLRQEGIADQAEGETQEAWGRGKRRVGEALEDLGDKIKR